jgi:hypothetical protein
MHTPCTRQRGYRADGATAARDGSDGERASRSRCKLLRAGPMRARGSLGGDGVCSLHARMLRWYLSVRTCRSWRCRPPINDQRERTSDGNSANDLQPQVRPREGTGRPHRDPARPSGISRWPKRRPRSTACPRVSLPRLAGENWRHSRRRVRGTFMVPCSKVPCAWYHITHNFVSALERSLLSEPHLSAMVPARRYHVGRW